MAHESLNENGNLIAEAIIKALAANGVEAKVEKTYLDYGQDWTWDTIIVRSATGSYQALNPAQHKAMNEGTFNYADINDIVAFAVKHQ